MIQFSQIIKLFEDIDRVERLESLSFDVIVHLGKFCHTSVCDVVRLDENGDAQYHVSDQHVDDDSINDVIIYDPLSHEFVDE